ncbi:unnamed protein product [Phytophthora fragariaefolia]|uniref:RNA-directed DNA polymerase n=1 Tax=Phytophthora fragariaefolia TaxID=1490495 RepID=A0A9W6TK01_9STRA|nr:unnamed protein product [Phytophthora fragariaefolia]
MHDCETKKVAMVHGAVNNCRTDILLDSGAYVSMMSLDLVRRLKLRLKFCKQLRVSGLGGVPTIITATTEVEITLGPRVVYIMELWVANIGEGVDVLLGMNFMYSAGVRLCAREGLAKLPDEETVLLAGRTADHMGRGLDLAATPKTCLYLGAGESAVVRIDNGQSNPQREVVWAGRGDRWVTQSTYAARSWSIRREGDQYFELDSWIDSRTAVARIVGFGFFPTAGRFVRPGLRRYKEWQVLIYEKTNSREIRKSEERLAQLRRESEPPCGWTPEYQWPKKLLVRSSAGLAQLHMVRLQPRPNVGTEKSPAKTDVQLSETEISGTSDSEGAESREAKFIEGTGGSHEDSGNSGEILEDRGPVVVRDEDSDSDDEAFYDTISFDDDDGGEDSQEVVKAESSTGACSDWLLHPVRRLEKAYERCMQMSAEELSFEPARNVVYEFGYGEQILGHPDDGTCEIDFGFRLSVRTFSADTHAFWAQERPIGIPGSNNNYLWGFGRLSPEVEVEVDQDVLEFLGLGPSKREDPGSQVSALTDTVTVFQRNIPAPASMGPDLGRSSYIDDIAHCATTWDQLCDDLEALLFRLRYWNISVSLPKTEFGKLSILYLSHEISAEGIRVVPKIAKGVQDLPFPKTLKGVQLFLGSLNYYPKFIEDFPVVDAVLNELSDDQVRSERDLTRAKAAFETLKKIVSTTLLRHPDRFTGRVLNNAELRYHVAEKEVIAVLRVLQVFRTLLEGCRLEVYTRHSVFKWIIQSKTADGRCVPWEAILSHWDITVRKVQRDENGLAAIMGAGITPREHLDEVAESLIPAKRRVRKPPVLSVEMLDDTYQGIVLSFDGAAKTSTRRGKADETKSSPSGWRSPSRFGKTKSAEGERGRCSQSAPLPQAARVFAVLTRSKPQARTPPSPEVFEDAPPDEEEPRRPMTPLEDFLNEPRLEIPDALRPDMLHYAHEDFQGGHQGITRTYEKLRSGFYWPGMYADVEHYVKECVDCTSGKGRPPNEGPSPGNIEPRRPFEVVSMDFVTHMPESERGNTFLLLFQDVFSGFVMCKPMKSTTAQDVAEVYEECVFRRFGASSMVRHDQDPRFMSETVVRCIRAYIAEADQSDWDDHAERHMFALNTSFDATRLDTPFYLVHGWGAQGTVSAMLGPKPSSIPERTAFEWRRKMQRQYGYAIACVEDLQKKAKRQRSEIQTKRWKELSERLKSGFENGDSVWLKSNLALVGSSLTYSGPPMVQKNSDFQTYTGIAGQVEGYDDSEWLPLSQLSCGALMYEFNQGARARARFQPMLTGDDHPRA